MISIVIPLYNKTRSIRRTIESVLDQTFSDFELIVVNDGSTDGGEYVVSKIKDDRIRLVSKTNGGVSSARNEGIKMSKGDYVSFLDADDYWDRTYLENVNRMINLYPDAGLIELGYGKCQKGIRTYARGTFPADFEGIVENPWSDCLYCWTGSTTIRRDIFDVVGFFDERMDYGEDFDMWWRVILNYECAFLNKPFAWYEQDSENRAMNRAIPFEKHFPFYIEKYKKYRDNNREFRFFFDRESLYRLFQYTSMKKYRKDLRRVLRQIDFSLQKRSMRLRFIFPRLYRVYLNKKSRL